MQTQVSTSAPQEKLWWHRERTVLAGLWLLALVGLYFVVVLPLANSEVPPDFYRFPFSFITLIYAADLTILGIDYVYKLARPPRPPPREKLTKLNVVDMILRTGFMICVGGSYLTGASIATPPLFAPVLTYLPFLGNTVTYVAEYYHSLFAALIIGFGTTIIVFELVKIGAHKSSFRSWFIKSRYPEIKLFYWLIAIAVIIQGVLGLYLLGTISPIGPFGLLGNNTYAFESLIRHIHGPLGALIFALFTNHIYFRIRPEFRIR
jgi:hypothetical protein